MNYLQRAFYIVSLSSLFFSCALTKKHPHEREVASRSPSILHIGDSQTRGPFGKFIYQYLKEKSDNVNVYGVSSSSPRHWVAPTYEMNWLCKQNSRHNENATKSMKKNVCSIKKQTTNGFAEVLKRHSPDIVFFQFLGNSMQRSRKQILTSLKQLLSMLNKRQKCVFITSPPYYKDLVERNKLRGETHRHFLDGIGKRCRVVQGFHMPGYADRYDYFYTVKNGKTRGDGMHFNAKGAQAYMDYIVDQLSDFF